MGIAKKLWRNRKEKKEWVRRLQSENPGLEVVHPRAAGIDVGDGALYAAVRPDRDPQVLRKSDSQSGRTASHVGLPKIYTRKFCPVAARFQ
jgi:hypothetical protein